MDQILRQLGELLLGAVPPSSFWDAIHLYTFLVHRPLVAVLAERRSRTRERWKKRAPTSPRPKPHCRLRATPPRSPPENLQEPGSPAPASQPVSRPSRPTSRTRAQEQVKQARAALEGDKQQAMAGLESGASRLATEIVRTVLRPMASPSQVGGQ